jgi:hypothetical protein
LFFFPFSPAGILAAVVFAEKGEGKLLPTKGVARVDTRTKVEASQKKMRSLAAAFPPKKFKSHPGFFGKRLENAGRSPWATRSRT